MTQQQTGEQQMASYSQALSRQLQRVIERLDLDTAETEELMHWASTATASPIPNICQAQRMLMNGLKGLSSTTNNQDAEDMIVEAVLQARPRVRYAAVVRRPGHTPKVVVYMGR